MSTSANKETSLANVRQKRQKYQDTNDQRRDLYDGKKAELQELKEEKKRNQEELGLPEDEKRKDKEHHLSKEPAETEVGGEGKKRKRDEADFPEEEEQDHEQPSNKSGRRTKKVKEGNNENQAAEPRAKKPVRARKSKPDVPAVQATRKHRREGADEESEKQGGDLPLAKKRNLTQAEQYAIANATLEGTAGSVTGSKNRSVGPLVNKGIVDATTESGPVGGNSVTASAILNPANLTSPSPQSSPEADALAEVQPGANDFPVNHAEFGSMPPADMRTLQEFIYGPDNDKLLGMVEAADDDVGLENGSVGGNEDHAAGREGADFHDPEPLHHKDLLHEELLDDPLLHDPELFHDPIEVADNLLQGEEGDFALERMLQQQQTKFDYQQIICNLLEINHNNVSNIPLYILRTYARVYIGEMYNQPWTFSQSWFPNATVFMQGQIATVFENGGAVEGVEHHFTQLHNDIAQIAFVRVDNLTAANVDSDQLLKLIPGRLSDEEQKALGLIDNIFGVIGSDNFDLIN